MSSKSIFLSSKLTTSFALRGLLTMLGEITNKMKAWELKKCLKDNKNLSIELTRRPIITMNNKIL